MIPDEFQMKSIGDYPLAMWLMYKGDIYYINEVMSVYRSNVENSWTQRTNGDRKELLNHFIEKNQYIKRFNKNTHNKYLRYTIAEYLDDIVIISSIKENFIKYMFWNICRSIYCFFIK